MKKFRSYIKAFIVVVALGCGAVSVFAEPGEGYAQTVVTTQPQVRVLGGRVEITVPGDEERPVTIYALTGQVVKSLSASPGVTTVELPKGYYIVKCDRVSCRVVVK